MLCSCGLVLASPILDTFIHAECVQRLLLVLMLMPTMLQAIRANLHNDELQQMLSEVEAVLDEDAQVSLQQQSALASGASTCHVTQSFSKC